MNAPLSCVLLEIREVAAAAADDDDDDDVAVMTMSGVNLHSR